MRFVCESCRAQYMINDEKVGPKGVKVRCRKCGYVILVKRSDASATASSPSSVAKLGPAQVASSGDVEDATATQVMQTPGTSFDVEPKTELMNNVMINGLNDSLSLDDEALRATKKALSPDNFLGADDDEIGAVFDQVLRGGPSSETHNDHPSHVGIEEDRENTRVIDAQTAKKLAEASYGVTAQAAPVAETGAEEVPTTDWYVAVNDKQTGPLTLEAIKGHWDKGEIGPDSLCWRAGYSDWLPLSEVRPLASVLAPKPPKPIVVAAAATITSSLPGSQSVMSVPVQSAFSSGGMMQSVQSEMQVPISAHAPEETGTWRPSAASALASLVKDEMDAMAKPAVPVREKVQEEAPARSAGGLLDLPEASGVNSNPRGHGVPAAERAERAAQPPVNPYLANPAATYSAPALTQYRPPTSRGMLVGFIGGGVVVVALFGLVVWLLLREPKVIPVPTQVPAAVAQGVVPPVAAAQAAGTVPAVADVAPTAVAPTAVAPTAVAPTGVAPPTPIAAAPTAAPTAPPTHFGGGRQGGGSTKVASREKVDKAETEPAPEAKKTGGKGDEDGFNEAFGGGSDRKGDKSAESPKKPREVYIPPAPGSGGDIKEELGQSDIFEVVVASKPALAKCVEEQHKKDPGLSGKLVMKWTVLTSGRTSNISVASDEFKGSSIASCIQGLVKGWVFPKSKKQMAEPVQFPFKF
jgi:predicted Zn finger-like uncharacterized protein